jgi:lysozyme family protein
MSAYNFPAALKLLLQSEGGNDDDPADHGGRTSRGIIQREYDAWRREHSLPIRDVWTATDDEIATIYLDEYWNPFCDAMPAGVDYLYFDMAVNAGPHRAAVMLQRALGVTDDGRIGPITREAFQKADVHRLITDFSDAKRNFYRSLHQPKFINGWLNRTAIVEKNAIALTI